MSGQDKRPQSIAPDAPVTQQKGTGVKASPFNTVKLELAMLLVLAVALILVVPTTAQGMLWLSGYALLAACWLTWRTRRVLRRHSREGGHGA
ncbi:MAG: hypothetical protein PVH46_02165 [Granulosicoccaceae bacterium]|jgi:hypothetical protein